MEDVFVACRVNSHKYPANLPFPSCSSSKTLSYLRELDELEPDLFDPREHKVEFFDHYHGTHGFQPTTATSMEDALGLCPLRQPTSLGCRFICLYSSDTRSPLFVSRQMLTVILTYHQMRAHFLDFLFMYGDQEEPRDPFFTSFRAYKTIREGQQCFKLPSLHRSGDEFNICYNLRAPERSTGNRLMPWSIRPAVLYHTFDTISGQCVWLNLKGNESMSEELTNEAKRLRWTNPDPAENLVTAFSASLRIQVFFCEWSRENWKKYIKYLSDELNKFTKALVTEEFQERPMPAKPEGHVYSPERPRTNSFFRRLSWKSSSGRISTGAGRSTAVPLRQLHNATNGITDNLVANDEFKIPSLQSTQYLEEKVRDAKFYLQGNIKNVKSVVGFYRNLHSLPEKLRNELEGFESELHDIIYDLEMHYTSLENVLQLTGERKALLSSILDYQNKKASEFFATKAQYSAQKMEEISEDMRNMTRRTKRETVSMKVLAGVTMFYLPGTFVSALMSTPVVRWEQMANGKFVLQPSSGTWQFFIALALPLMFVTFIAWIITSWWSNREMQDSGNIGTTA